MHSGTSTLDPNRWPVRLSYVGAHNQIQTSNALLYPIVDYACPLQFRGEVADGNDRQFYPWTMTVKGSAQFTNNKATQGGEHCTALGACGMCPREESLSGLQDAPGSLAWAS